MKNLRITLMIAILLLTVALVGAQEDVETTVEADAVSGTFIQFADSATLIEDEMGDLTLTLAGVDDATAWQFIAPDLTAGRFDTSLLAIYWSAADDLSTEAVLTSGNVVVEVTLSMPDYNLETGVMRFDAEVSDFYLTPTDLEIKGFTLPEEFDATTLMINFEQDFIDSLNAGRDAAGFRATVGNNCSAPQC
jgi:hypothetical protein